MQRRAAVVIVAILTAALAAVTAAVATPQAQQGKEFIPPPGAEMQINLYPISKFRGNPVVLTKSEPNIRRPIQAESVLIIRGVWELCAQTRFDPPCVRFEATRQGLPVAITVRSARLVGDQGPSFADAPVQRAGPDVQLAPSGEVVMERPKAAPVVAPTVAQGGEPGTNPSLKGTGVEFFPAPARNGLRVVACAQGKTTPRCAQAAADGFCADSGYRDSGWREFELVRGRDYLINVLCKAAADNDGGKDASGFQLPSLFSR